ncbi:hypothetical protein AND_005564 [Anopheles darlingi]|uniref:Uncharacterized protein n=1 Tax=Anopheles darlingi TaxID=43151 RepID=W5JFB1_ANODA|nr:hypothetical protein AND_005564 [Anopheles darlingi]
MAADGQPQAPHCTVAPYGHAYGERHRRSTKEGESVNHANVATFGHHQSTNQSTCWEVNYFHLSRWVAVPL